MASYGEYDKKERAWRGDSPGERPIDYKYALFNADGISFRNPGPEVFAHTLKEAMVFAMIMMSEGTERIEIGTPNGEMITIDARDCDAGERIREEEE
jgi:hypothetical protein